MTLLEGHDEAVAKFVARLSPIEQPEFAPTDRAFGVIRSDGALVAGAVFTSWRPQFNTLQLSGAAISSTAFRPWIIAQLGDYAFKKLGVFRLWARTSTDNKAARRFLKHVGFIEESTAAHFYGISKHAMTSRLIRPDWEAKWGPMLQRAA